MADLKLCSIPDCGKTAPSDRKGWCEAHYTRWRRNGHPLAGRTPNGDVERHYRETVLPYSGNECLIWPYNRPNGYAQMCYAGRQQSVHRLVCIEENGPPPSERHEAAHSCGNGLAGCVSRKHLVWKTRTENMADKLVHGTHNRGRSQKLTHDDVRQIRSLEDHKRVGEIASQFGVSHSTISDIISGKNWSWLEEGD